MGKKLLCLIMAMCCVFGLVACGEEKITADKAGTDNTLYGGFVAETNNYVYFINGIESYSTDYKTGEVTKGALLRVNKNDLNATPETVVSKLLVAGDTNAGFYIFGEYVYYAVSSNENDKTGTTKKDKLNFFRTKLDATDTSKNIVDRDFTNSVTYRFVQSGSNVYLIVHSTELYVYDAIEGGLVYTTEVNEEDKKYKKDEEALKADKLAKIDVSEVLFAGNNVYFTSNPINALLSNADNIQKEAFHVVYKLDFAGKDTKPVKVINGAGQKLVNGEKNPDGGFGILGVTIDLLRVENGNLYFTYTSLNTVEGGKTVYMQIPEADLKNTIANTWHKTESYVYSEATNNIASVFATGSIFHAGKVYYVQTNIGLLVYDHDKVEDETTDNGVSVLLSSELLKGATLDYVNVEGEVAYLYFHDASSNYYKLNLAEGKDAKVYRINEFAINTSWYKPEVVKSGNDYYFIAVYSGAEFKSYVYKIKMADLKTEDDEYWTEEKEETDDADVTFDVFAKQNGILGLVAEKDLQVASESVVA